MKRKFILLPITLTALAPTISMVGCGGDTPEPEYKGIELKVSGNYYTSDEFDLLKGNYYKFWIDNHTQARQSIPFTFIAGTTPKKVSVFVSKVLVGGNNITFQTQTRVIDNDWYLFFDVSQANTSIEIYLQCIETTKQIKASLGA